MFDWFLWFGLTQCLVFWLLVVWAFFRTNVLFDALEFSKSHADASRCADFT